MLTEEDLVRGCLNKDRVSEAELYKRYAARLYALCIRYSSDRESARDLMHDAMIKALGSLGSFKYSGEGSLYAWLRRLTVNMAIDRIRRRKVKLLSLGNVQEPPEEEIEEVPEIPVAVLQGMISSLPEERRAIFNMFCIDGYSHKEIAKAFGISEKGSASILAKARAQLRREIKDYLMKNE